MLELNCGTKKSNENLDQTYWNNQWENSATGWDIGYVSPPIASYFSKIENKNAKIFIPGCGNAYEAEFFLNKGFKDITLIDFAPKAIEILQEKFTEKKEIKIFCENFFNHNGTYDFIIEQTFFCDIPTLLRTDYVKKVHELLHENGKLVGLLFNKNFEQKGPPFGGSIAEYQFLFNKKFKIITLEPCENSIPKRKSSEFFIQFQKI